MIIKKFTGKTEAEATEAAKKELGNGLVIMNVREVKKKGGISRQSAEKSDNVPYAQALCGVALGITVEVS